MLNIFEAITTRLVAAWKSEEDSGRMSSFSCRCHRPVYFRNSLCLGCKASFLRSPEGGPRVLTGLANGLITLNVEDADDSIREETRQQMRVPCHA